MNNSNKILLSVFIVAFIGILIWNGIKVPKKDYENSMDLLYSTINGRVAFIEIERGVTIIGLNNRDEDLYINYFIDIDSQKKTVYDFIQVGDSIYSPYGSDSIYVIRNGEKKGYRMFIDYVK